MTIIPLAIYLAEELLGHRNVSLILIHASDFPKHCTNSHGSPSCSISSPILGIVSFMFVCLPPWSVLEVSHYGFNLNVPVS